MQVKDQKVGRKVRKDEVTDGYYVKSELMYDHTSKHE